MSISSWTPDNDIRQLRIDCEWLQRCIALSRDEQLDALSPHFSDDEVREYAPLMRAQQEQWEQAVADLSDAELIHLIRFFTVAEMQLSGWEAGNRSPVIWIYKVLRRRGGNLDRDILLWIKQRSDNRFLPHGGL